MKLLNFILLFFSFNILLANRGLTDQEVSLIQDFVSFLRYDQTSNTFSLKTTNFNVENFLANGNVRFNVSSLSQIQIGNQFNSGIKLSVSESLAEGITLQGNVYTSGNLKLDGNLETRGDVILEGTLYGSQVETNNATFDILDVSTQCNIPGQTNLSGQINISGITTFTGTTNINGGTLNFNINPYFNNVSGSGFFLCLDTNNQLILKNAPELLTFENINATGYLNIGKNVFFNQLSVLSLNNQPSTKLLFLNTDKEVVSFSPFTQQNNILTTFDLNTIGADGTNTGQIYGAISNTESDIRKLLDSIYLQEQEKVDTASSTNFGTTAATAVNVGNNTKNLVLQGAEIFIPNIAPSSVESIEKIICRSSLGHYISPSIDDFNSAILSKGRNFGTVANSNIIIGNKTLSNINLNLEGGIDSSINISYRESIVGAPLSTKGIFLKYENTQVQKSINLLQLQGLTDERKNLVSFITFGGTSDPNNICFYQFSNLEARNPSGFYSLFVDHNGVLYRDLTTKSYNLNENKNYSITISEKHIECINNFLKKTFSKDNNSEEQKNNNNYVENLIDIIQQQDKEIELLKQNYYEEIKNLKKENKSIIKKLNKLIDTLKKLNLFTEENKSDDLKYKDID